MTEQAAAAIRIDGTRLRDRHGREVILRGVNLGGDTKLPYPDGGTHIPTDFADHRTVSFVGRPFPLDEADAHFRRLRRWGFNCLRLLTTWEAVEHSGPGLYDTAYLDYLAAIAARAGTHGFFVFVDFHQDVWSRMSGGSGAPGWTFDAVGLDFSRLPAADAAIVMQSAIDPSNPDPHQPGYPQMVWSSNYGLPANGVMWTLFWLGRTATPDLKIDGRNVQDYLQDHYLAAVAQVAVRLAPMPHVIGFDTLNEPGTGWAGLPLSRPPLDRVDPASVSLKPGPSWTPLDALVAASGRAVTLPVLSRAPDGGLAVIGQQVFNAAGVRIWRDDRPCPFEEAGIYRWDGGAMALRERVFSHVGDRPLSLSDDCYAPFFARLADTVRVHRADWSIFAEMDPYAVLQQRRFPAAMPPGWINASHWYDIALLYNKALALTTSRDILSGEPDRDASGLAARYRRQLGGYAAQSAQRGVPTLIGEFGIPFDLDHGAAYRAWAAGDHGDAAWADHRLALTLMYDALDALLIHSTQWNYTASNRNDPWIGDGWNQEDLSIWSVDQVGNPADPDAGGRAIDGFSRPYVQAAQGTIQAMRFDDADATFTATILTDPEIDAPTEIFVPGRRYRHGVIVTTSPALPFVHDATAQLVRIQAVDAGALTVMITPAAA